MIPNKPHQHRHFSAIDHETILQLEHQRQQAYLSRDFARLDPLFDDDLAYVHSSGFVEDKPTYLTNVVKVPEFLSIERVDPQLRFLSGDVAVLGGVLRSHTRRGDGSENRSAHYLSQVWRRDGAHWRQVLYQLSPLPAA